MSQAIDIQVPDIGDFADVPVIEVFVKVGDTVKAEDPLVSLESDKATMDVPAPRGGVVKAVAVKIGDKVSQGSMIMQFEAEDGTTNTTKDQELNFDWAAGRVTGKFEKSAVNLPLQPGLLDSLSVQAALMHELLSGRTPARFVLVDKGRIKDYNYSAEGEDILRTPLGEHRTVIFRSARPGSPNGTWFWCAPDMNFLPLKVERREGKNVQWALRLQSVTIQ